jgi:hypothetical protein
MEGVYTGVVRAGGSPLDLLDGGDECVTVLPGEGVVGAPGSSLTINCSPGLRPRLDNGSSGTTVSPLGGYPAFTAARKGKGDEECWRKLHTTLARRKNV